MTAFATVPSPVGPLALEAQAGRLTAVRFDEGHGATAPTEAPELAAAATQLAHYFSGRRRTFELPLAPPVGPFDRRVLGALTEISYGERISYGELTASLAADRDGAGHTLPAAAPSDTSVSDSPATATRPPTTVHTPEVRQLHGGPLKG
jgi:O6-methylguanine-DNA--protein-cysteine methyltransferase